MCSNRYTYAPREVLTERVFKLCTGLTAAPGALPIRRANGTEGAMTREHTSSKDPATLPEELRSLITRKLRHQKRELDRSLAGVIQSTYSKLQEEMLASLQARQVGRAFVSVPIETYHQIVAATVAATNTWPSTVWKTIASTLKKTPVVPRDSHDLDAISNQFTWTAGQEPFTLKFIEPQRFGELVRRQASRYGGIPSDMAASFDRQLGIASSAARVGVLNTAKDAREAIRIAIQEYLIERSNTPDVGHANSPRLLPALADSDQNTEKSSKNLGQTNSVMDPETGSSKWRTQNAQRAANARHNQPGGSRDKQQRIREIWATGKYSSRDICAEQECAGLGMSFSAARKALRNTPDP